MLCIFDKPLLEDPILYPYDEYFSVLRKMKRHYLIDVVGELPGAQLPGAQTSAGVSFR